MTSRQFTASLALAAALAVTGCAAKQKPQKLTPQAFAAPRTEVGGPIKPSTPPPAPPETPKVLTSAGSETPAVTPAPPPAPVVTDSKPAIGKTTGQYLTLGGVVAEVNSNPIYASKVLALLDKPLRERAKQLDAAGFRRAAMQDIDRTIKELVSMEIEVAAAVRNLDDDERRQADLQTMAWRMQEITKAGGSIELAKRKARFDEDGRETGLTFDDLVDERRRGFLVQIYYQKRVIPRIQVSATDIREFYEKNLGTLYTQNELVKFHVLSVDAAKTGSKEKAIDKIAEKHKRAKAGEDFAEMCVKENDTRMFASAKPFESAPSSFAIVKIRDVLKTLPPGQISEVIEDKGTFYVVKVEARQEGRTRAFDEPKVQDDIRNRLRAAQYSALRQAERVKLARTALIRMDVEMLNIAVEMAMQKYGQYAAAK